MNNKNKNNKNKIIMKKNISINKPKKILNLNSDFNISRNLSNNNCYILEENNIKKKKNKKILRKKK